MFGSDPSFSSTYRPKFAVLTILRALEVGLMFRAYHHVFYCCHYNRSFITPRAIELKMWKPSLSSLEAFISP